MTRDKFKEDLKNLITAYEKSNDEIVGCALFLEVPDGKWDSAEWNGEEFIGKNIKIVPDI